MGDAEEGGMEAEDVTMAQSTTPTTTTLLAPIATGMAIAAGTGIEKETATSASVPNV